MPPPHGSSSNGLWQGDNPIHFAVPLLILQICLVLAVSRALAALLKHLGQPRVIAEIIGGILLGPSVLGRFPVYINNVFPKQSITVLDTVANLGLIFFLFLVGLELDLKAIKKAGKQTLAIAGGGITLPFSAGVGVSLVLHKTVASDARFLPFVIFMGVAVSITAFPVLARILAERKILTTDVGQMAMSAAAVNDLAAWILLALAVALSSSNKSALVSLWVLLCGLGFLVVMFLIVKPLMVYIAARAEENRPLNELHVAITFAGVLAAGFATDAIGIHAIFGAFVFGLIIPKDGPFPGMLTEKIEDLVTTLMLPLYFASSGLKTNIGTIHTGQSVGLLCLVIVTACAGKIIGTMTTALIFKTNLRKSLTLGFLMNTKGLVELIVLNIGKEKKVLNEETFAIMVLMAIFTTIITTPAVMLVYKPARNPVPHTRRKLYLPGKNADDGDLRVLACVHGMSNVHALINLVEISRGTRKWPLKLYILHLLQLTERPSSFMKFQNIQHLDGHSFRNENDRVVLAFQAYGQLSKVNVQAMTALSSLDNMHEDICATATEKRAVLVVLPFHKHARLLDQVWEGNHPGLRNVNRQVLLHSPCSVGILVDRRNGLLPIGSNLVDHNVAVLFFGGPDCREALVFGLRMAEHPGVNVKVYRFVYKEREDHCSVAMPADEVLRPNGAGNEGNVVSCTKDSVVTGGYDLEEENILDEGCLAMAKEKAFTSSNKNNSTAMITFEEREVSDAMSAAAEVAAIKTFTLVVLGRGRRPSPLLAILANTYDVEYPELGPVGNVLLKQEGEDNPYSILVIQQHDPASISKEGHQFTVKGDVSSLPQGNTSAMFSRTVLVATYSSSGSSASSSSSTSPPLSIQAS